MNEEKKQEIGFLPINRQEIGFLPINRQEIGFLPIKKKVPSLQTLCLQELKVPLNLFEGRNFLVSVPKQEKKFMISRASDIVETYAMTLSESIEYQKKCMFVSLVSQGLLLDIWHSFLLRLLLPLWADDKQIRTDMVCAFLKHGILTLDKGFDAFDIIEKCKLTPMLVTCLYDKGFLSLQRNQHCAKQWLGWITLSDHQINQEDVHLLYELLPTENLCQLLGNLQQLSPCFVMQKKLSDFCPICIWRWAQYEQNSFCCRSKHVQYWCPVCLLQRRNVGWASLIHLLPE